MAQGPVSEGEAYKASGASSNSTAASSTGVNGSTGSSSTSSSVKKPVVQNLIQLINASHLRFAWFLSNVAVVVNSLLYFLSYFKKGIFNQLWYRFTFVGAVATFGIVIFQNLNSYKKATTNKFSVRALLQDDNTHYLYDAMIWLLFPKQSLAIIPFLSFSTFHVLNFTGSELLPALRVLPALSQKLKVSTKENHDLSRRVAASAELLLLLVLVFKSLLLRKWSLISLIAYSVFIKVKSEGSVFTKNALKSWEVRIDGLVSNQSVPPVVKAQWGNIKRFLKSVNKFSLIQKAEEKTN